jgi:hypothetical protein
MYSEELLTTTPDEYSTRSFAAKYEDRRQAFFDFILSHSNTDHIKSVWYELARLAAGGTPDQGVFLEALDCIEKRKDGADIQLHAILRLLYQFPGDNRLDNELLERARQSVLDFKYWPDEPGADSMCMWSENHYILFSSAAYLAGQLYTDQIFTNSGQTGRKKMEIHRTRLLRWMNLRFFTGFSEWLSNVYTDENLAALLSLVDFCQDEEICCKAEMLIDLLLFEMAVNNFDGVFGSTHGCSWEASLKWAALEKTSPTMKLLFGRGVFTNRENMSAAAFALSQRYKLPTVIYEIANDRERSELLQRQRVGISLDQADWWDLEPKGFENGMLLLTLGAYLHPRSASLFIKMLDSFNLWEHEEFEPYRKRRALLKTLRSLGLLPFFARRYEHDLSRGTREEANLYTYRTPDYMLSSAQDYRKGYGGDQQHIWQATLGPDAVCFTTHPPRLQGSPPNYWTGSGSLPRVAQVKNVLIAIYRITKERAINVPNQLFYSHAWLPRDRFEEVVEKEGWIFARLGEGYLALLSEHPYEWRELPGEEKGREVIVQARNNIWLCELGRRAINGSFAEFMERILEAEVLFSGSNVSYRSPTQGLLQFGWKAPLRRDGRTISLTDYPRYASPYAQAAFPSEQVNIQLGDHTLSLDWVNGERQVSTHRSIND